MLLKRYGLPIVDSGQGRHAGMFFLALEWLNHVVVRSRIHVRDKHGEPVGVMN